MNEILILFVMMFVGFLARRLSLIGAELNLGLARLVLNVTMPMMIIGAFHISVDGQRAAIAGQILLFSILLHAGMFWISRFLFRGFDAESQKVLRFSSVFSNCAFMGFPLMQAMYGEEGLFYASIFFVPFIVSLWTVGVMIFDDRVQMDWRKAVLNPGLIAVGVGAVLFAFKLALPGFVLKSCHLIGSTTTPLAMILVGSSLTEVHIKDLVAGGRVYYAALMRLIIIPLVLLAFMFFCGAKGVVLGVCVVAAAMPVAANTAAFAENFRSNTALASRCIFVSTILSIITIPFFIWLVKLFN